MTLLDGALDHIFGLFHRNDMPSSPKTPISQRSSDRSRWTFPSGSNPTCIRRSKPFIPSGLVSQATNGTQKLQRAAEAGKLKFEDNKDHFLFKSELQGTLNETANLSAARDVGKAGEKVEELRNSLRHRQKIIKLADKSDAGWLAVKEYQTEVLASDSENEIKKSARKSSKEERKCLQKS